MMAWPGIQAGVSPQPKGRAGPPDPPHAHGPLLLRGGAGGPALPGNGAASRRSGIALIITLGLITVITLAAVAFIVVMRIDRLAARNALDRMIARHYTDVALAQAMTEVDVALHARVYPCNLWLDSSAYAPMTVFQATDVFGGVASNDNTVALFRGALTNFVPLALAAQARNARSGWIGITETNRQTGADGITAGRVSFLVINLSGLLDVHALTEAGHQAMGEPGDQAYALLQSLTGLASRVFFTQPDLNAANGGPVSNLVTLSYDPGPDVFVAATNTPMLGMRGFGGALTNRFNINNVTNATGLNDITPLLQDAGVFEPTHVAYNVLNYVNDGRIPIVASGDSPEKVDYGVKDIPLINRIAVEQSTSGLEYTVGVQLWYPFVPRASPNNVRLQVDVYTNLSVLSVPASPDLEFPVDVPVMNYHGDSNDYFVARIPNPIVLYEAGNSNPVPISATHPIWIWPRVIIGGTNVDEASVNIWTNVGVREFADPRANYAPAAAVFTNEPPGPVLEGPSTICSVSNLPLVIAGEPMRSAGELRHIYAPGMRLPSDLLDLSTIPGAACRDRFTVRQTNAPMHGLVQANSPWTNVWRAALADVAMGWTNATGGTRGTLGDDGASLDAVAGAIPAASLATDGSGWVRFQDMLPDIAKNLLSAVGSQVLTNAATSAALGDILAGIADRVSFRQNVFLVIACGQRLSPLGRVLADQRAATVVVRDAFTGRWVVNSQVWLTN